MIRSVTAPGLATIDRVWTAQTDVERVTRAIVLIVAGTVLLWMAARVQIPAWPVKASLQSLVVMLIGAAYGARLGMMTIAAYLAEGIAGLPVFQSTPENGIGLVYMAGPTGGYLIGFVALAGLIGFAVERGYGTSFLAMLAATVAANVLFYVVGISWLAHIIGAEKAIGLGLTPFLLADTVKILIVASLTVVATRRTAA